MNIKTAMTLSAVSIILSTGAANANLLFDIYAGGTYGVGGYTLFADDDHISKSSQSYGAVLGMDIPLFRIEAEYNYIDTDNLSMNIGMINGYFKLPTPMVKPYIGAGIGTTFSSEFTPVAHTTIDIDDTIVYQGMLGVTLDIPVVPFNIDVEGRVIYASDLIEYMNDTADVLQYEGRVKLRYVF